MKLQAIYAILHEDASAIVSMRLTSMRELGQSGRKYGSYNARYEDNIVAAMVAHDGGSAGDMQIERSEGKLSMFDAVKAGRVDATWIFLPWEGTEAELDGVHPNYFKLADYDIPYGYSPVIARNAGADLSAEVLKAFVAATREGYEYAMEHADAAADVLHDIVNPPRSMEFLRKSQASINGYYTTDGHKPGYMEATKWTTWLQWLKQQHLMTGPNEVKLEDVFTSEFAT